MGTSLLRTVLGAYNLDGKPDALDTALRAMIRRFKIRPIARRGELPVIGTSLLVVSASSLEPAAPDRCCLQRQQQSRKDLQPAGRSP
jgi:hypothetical protein